MSEPTPAAPVPHARLWTGLGFAFIGIAVLSILCSIVTGIWVFVVWLNDAVWPAKEMISWTGPLRTGWEWLAAASIDHSRYSVWSEMAKDWQNLVGLVMIPSVVVAALFWLAITVGLWVWRGFRSG